MFFYIKKQRAHTHTLPPLSYLYIYIYFYNNNDKKNSLFLTYILRATFISRRDWKEIDEFLLSCAYSYHDLLFIYIYFISKDISPLRSGLAWLYLFFRFTQNDVFVTVRVSYVCVVWVFSTTYYIYLYIYINMYTLLYTKVHRRAISSIM